VLNHNNQLVCGAAGLLEAAGQKLPFVDEVHLPLIEETQPQMLKFKRGRIAYVGINRDDFELMAIRKDREFSLKPEFADNIYPEIFRLAFFK
jgi:hypothetical protein